MIIKVIIFFIQLKINYSFSIVISETPRYEKAQHIAKLIELATWALSVKIKGE